MSTHRPELDQANDPLAQFYRGTAETYHSYMQREYDVNYRNRAEEWDKHYGNMESVFNECFIRLINGRARTREDLNVVLVGPGMEPVNHDYKANTIVQNWLRHVKRIVVKDFDPLAVRSAMSNLSSGNRPQDEKVEPHKVYGMQYDLTRGLSTGYQRFISKSLDKVSNEDQLSLVATEFDMDEEALRDRLEHEITVHRMEMLQNPPPPMVNMLPGGENIAGLPKLSIEGKPIDTDLWLVPMVLSGTGAAAEDQLWDVFNGFTGAQLPDNFREIILQPDQKLQLQRERTQRNIHRLISRYNTMVSKKAIQDILTNNPRAQVLVITDVSTKWHASHEKYSRLYMDELREALDSVGIYMKPLSYGWDWNDEPEHSHGIECFVCTNLPHTIDALEGGKAA